jgi:hypothetical protein
MLEEELVSLLQNGRLVTWYSIHLPLAESSERPNAVHNLICLLLFKNTGSFKTQNNNAAQFEKV